MSKRCVVFGRYGTEWAWTHDGVYPREIFFKRQRRLPLQIRFAGGKFRVCCNKDAGGGRRKVTATTHGKQFKLLR
jgi:hypothetical protein